MPPKAISQKLVNEIAHTDNGTTRVFDLDKEILTGAVNANRKIHLLGASNLLLAMEDPYSYSKFSILNCSIVQNIINCFSFI